MPTAKAPSYVCVYFGTPGECHNCGGWTKSVGEDGVAGPFPGDARYCSEECFAEAQEFAERAQRARETDWCPACGFDRHEHSDTCPSAHPATLEPDAVEPDSSGGRCAPPATSPEVLSHDEFGLI